MAQSIITDPLNQLLSPLKMTYEAFLAWEGEEGLRYEWVDGEAVCMGTVSGEHNEVGKFLIKIIDEFVLMHQLGVVRYDPFNMKTGKALPGRAPDILFIANENLSRLRKNHVDGPADLVIEIISPESRGRDLKEKFDEYERGGVGEYWVFDPETQESFFFQRDMADKFQRIPVSEKGIYRSTVLSGFWLRTDWLWQRPQPSMVAILREWESN